VACGPAPAIAAILFTDPRRAPFAAEDLHTFAWGSAGGSTPFLGDYLVIVALMPLNGDELVLSASGGVVSFVIAGGGPWTGCGF
jgi:hypothetical protein